MLLDIYKNENIVVIGMVYIIFMLKV